MNWKTMLLTRPQGYVTEPIGLFALNYAFKAALLSANKDVTDLTHNKDPVVRHLESMLLL